MKNNKGFIGVGIIVAIIAAFIIGGGVVYVATKNSNLPALNLPENNLVGNDRDAHGCIGSAGYTWCEAKSKCLRSWEEKCEAIPAPAPIPVSSCTSKTAPWIKVLSPNGGETFTAGDKITVKWESCNNPGSPKLVAISLRGITNGTYNGTFQSLSKTGINDSYKPWLSVSIPDTGSYTTTIPAFSDVDPSSTGNFVPGNNFKINITMTPVEYNSIDDYSDNSFTIKAKFYDLSTFSLKYISPYPNQWPPVVWHNTTGYSCSTITRDVFGTSMILKGTQININERTFCKYSFSDVGAGHAAGVYTYITSELSGVGTERVDFRVDWPNGCGGYGGPGDSQYDQCKIDQSIFFDNIDTYISSIMK